MTQDAYYLTTPIYYVNDVPHIGHAYTSIATDVLARLYRLTGKHVHFVTGVDEHGQKIENSAEKAGIPPQEFVDKIAERFRSLSQLLNISEDDFIRTTQERHIQAAQAMWQRLVDRDQIYLGKYSGWYSVKDETYFSEDELVDGKAPTGAEVEWIEEPSYFFRLSQWQEPLLKYYEEHPEAIGPKTRRNEVLSFIKSGLRDLSVSRSTFKWGVPVPNDPDHVMYVWIEALTNYLTTLDFPNTESVLYKKFWPHATHILGKDIIRHHAVYWPAFLLAADLPPAKRVYAHGWLTVDGEKMSKSVGNVIDPYNLVDQFGVDAVRFFLMREVPFGKDGQYSAEAFIRRINTDLANDLGNLCQRVLSFAFKHCSMSVPTPGDFTDADKAILDKAKAMPETILEFADHQKINKVCDTIWDVISDANRYVDSQEPWALRKTDISRMETVLYVLMEVIRHVAVCTQALMPDSSKKILDMLKIAPEDRDFESLENKPLKAGDAIEQPTAVFPRIDDSLAKVV